MRIAKLFFIIITAATLAGNASAAGLFRENVNAKRMPTWIELTQKRTEPKGKYQTDEPRENRPCVRWTCPER